MIKLDSTKFNNFCYLDFMLITFQLKKALISDEASTSLILLTKLTASLNHLPKKKLISALPFLPGFTFFSMICIHSAAASFMTALRGSRKTAKKASSKSNVKHGKYVILFCLRCLQIALCRGRRRKRRCALKSLPVHSAFIMHVAQIVIRNEIH
jgi:hypothetical protein